MREQSVVADGDAQAGGDPIEDEHGGDPLPAPETGQQGNDGENMNSDHESDRAPATSFFGSMASSRADRALKPGR